MKLIVSIKNNYLLLLILLLAAALRLYHVDFQSPWLDEVLTMNAANPDKTFSELYDHVMFWEYIPHLFFYLNHILFEIFGYTTLVGRVLSALIGVAGVYAIYLLGWEAYSKRTGLIAALLVSVNIFHIAYSQEMRPYGMLFLFSILSFYRLLVLLRTPTLKNAVYYGIFTGLIVHAHFFGLITIFAQCLILLFFVIISVRSNRIKFLKVSAVGGVVALLVCVPVIEAFIRVSGVEAFWLPKPTETVYGDMFKEFFGRAEVLLFIIYIVIVYYSITLFREKLTRIKYEEVVQNKLVLGGIVFFVWLFTSLTIPLLKSHLDIPMIVIRYFINILPVLILAISMGMSLIKNALIKGIVVFSFVSFSLIDIVVVKDYYNTITKTQFRELSAAIKERNPDNSTIVAHWQWIFDYYFDRVEVGSLEDYVVGLRKGTTDKKSFWYADGNSRTFTLSPEGQYYINQNFIAKEKLEFYDAWAIYYVPKELLGVTGKYDSAEIEFHVDTFESSSNVIKMQGWGFLKDSDTNGSHRDVVLIGLDNKVHRLPTTRTERPDVSTFYNNPKLHHTGYVVDTSIAFLPKGQYNVGIHILNKETGKEGLVITDKKVNVH